MLKKLKPIKDFPDNLCDDLEIFLGVRPTPMETYDMLTNIPSRYEYYVRYYYMYGLTLADLSGSEVTINGEKTGEKTKLHRTISGVRQEILKGLCSMVDIFYDKS